MNDSIVFYQLERKFDIQFNLKNFEAITVIEYDKEFAKDFMTLWNANCKEKVTMQELLELNGDGVFLAKYNGEVAGLVITDVIFDIDKNEKIGEIIEILVDFKYRRLGIGSTLLRKVEEHFRKKGVDKISFSIKKMIDEPTVIKIAKKFGFAITAIRKYKFNEDPQGLLKYDYIYKIMKLTCGHCNNKIDFLDVIASEYCPYCDKINIIDAMAS
ncbi:MAG: GNAT family N-acetyltransferase [Candidatus Lokiarchaeota archaeon]|nr:GNAT family N-acetyltransferase [Candidatus Lokiarchaeota archaeon]